MMSQYHSLQVLPLLPHQPSSLEASNLVMVPSTYSLRPGGGRHGRLSSSPLPTRTTSVGDLLDRRLNLKKLTVEKLDSISVH